MNITILSIASKTARKIAENMQVPIVYNANDIPEDTGLLIRWGNTSSIGQEIPTLNKREAIKLVANKFNARQFLIDKGIPTPELREDIFPCIGRPEKHHAGRRFWICRNEEDVRRAKRHGAVYFSPYYPKQDEYRVHIGDGKVIVVSEKIGNKIGKMCWNHKKTGFIFRHMKRHEWREDEKMMEVVRIAKKAIQAVGLDFGAVDVMANPVDHSMPSQVVAEINTSPSLSPLAIEKYIRYFLKKGGEL